MVGWCDLTFMALNRGSSLTRVIDGQYDFKIKAHRMIRVIDRQYYFKINGSAHHISRKRGASGPERKQKEEKARKLTSVTRLSAVNIIHDDGQIVEEAI